LSFEEIRRVVSAAVGLGISKVRLSGGEPLARLGIVQLARMVSSIPGVDDLSLSTNGMLLSRYAAGLKQAGVRRVNISLDTLRQDRFTAIARRGTLNQVLEGIEAARAARLDPVKINMVVIKDKNDDEVVDFASKTITDGWHVRFIELMPFGEALRQGLQFISIPHIKQKIEALGPLEPARQPRGNGPARYFRFHEAPGTIGFISPVSEHFCFGCNRLRLTAEGKLRPCLLDSHELDLRPALRGNDPVELGRLIREAVARKPVQHHLAIAVPPCDRTMAQIGG